MADINTITFKHSGHAGDIIYSLASVKYICEQKKAKAIFYIKINAPTEIKDHPVGSVMVSPAMYKFIEPLISFQDYIHEVKMYSGEKVDYDLDCFRDNILNLSAGNIALWYSPYYPELRPDLNQPWLKCKQIKPIFMPILARTERYLNPLTFPQAYIGQGYFIGVDKEWDIIKQLRHNLERLKVSNALDMANHIQAAPYVVSNQTLFFAIAEGLKTKRVLEQFRYAPNVIPQGGEWYTYTTNDQCKKLLLSLQP